MILNLVVQKNVLATILHHHLKVLEKYTLFVAPSGPVRLTKSSQDSPAV